MKKYLHILRLLVCSSAIFLFLTNILSASPNAPIVTTTGQAYRWSSDVNTLGARDGSWLTSLNQALIPDVIQDKVYRIRIGVNMAVTVTYGSGLTPAYINSFVLNNPIQFTTYYKKSTATNWRLVPTTSSDTAVMRVAPSAYISNRTIIGNSETANMIVLPKYGVTNAVGTRPANPYYYLGGKFFSTESSSTNVGDLGYTIGDVNVISQGSFVTNSSYTTSTSMNSQTYLNLGTEVEASIVFLKGVEANTLYDVRINLSVPFTGTGGTYSSSGTGGYNLSGTATPYLQGQFLTPASVLPIKLTSFIAKKEGNSVQLNWETASEINNKGFYIQRSNDGKTFNSLGFVGSFASGGTSNNILNYSYTDATPGTGAVYYRLNQVDLDGTSNYSTIQSLFLGTTSSDVMVAPNPVITSVNLNNALVGADYSIYSMSGQLVKSGKVSASLMPIDASNLRSGIYVIKTSNNAGVPVFKKFVKK
ncbi:T9SS type A sorting domain-containing protein [Rhizosphaericola mali]|uniref:T9SS type A sorting domain-containing protein n=1 Tax=Rhizosphaericola mali TaxID=2545455 RepID=A0A5P2G6F0_9BACT|nr:T9SS type A sorting domain-containing protein [Rhizosphaericola mali]QES90278.1 T9SS type A sorting domain-containing protein [Rhizosphaericola mali]